MSAQQEIGQVVHLDGHEVYTGTCSWTDKTLVQETDWYPERTMSAEDRLRYYAAHFPLTEIDSTYYAPPEQPQAALWAQRTPDGFRFDVKAYSLLTGHPTKPQSLWKDLREDLPPESRRSATSMPRTEPGGDGGGVAALRGALRPLHEAGRLGAVLFQYPPWFTPRRDNWADRGAARSPA